MVYSSIQKLSTIYEYISADHQSIAQNGGSMSVLIFVAPDCDSLCACKILTTLFKIDFILYQIKPVASYEDLMQAKGSLTADIRSIILLNCGANVDMIQFFELDPATTNKAIYIIDAHRPFHYQNILDQSGHVFIVGHEDEKVFLFLLLIFIFLLFYFFINFIFIFIFIFILKGYI